MISEIFGFVCEPIVHVLGTERSQRRGHIAFFLSLRPFFRLYLLLLFLFQSIFNSINTIFRAFSLHKLFLRRRILRRQLLLRFFLRRPSHTRDFVEAKKAEDKDNQDDNKPNGGGNSGTITVDATCAPSNIRYPQDVSLLNEARENAEKLLDILHSPTDGKKPRTYRKRARKDYLKYVRCRKHTAKMTRRAIGKQLNYLKRDLAAIDGKLNQGKTLNVHQTERLETICKIYEQQKYMYDNRTHSVENRIVSVSQPFVRPIVRGKAVKPVEFGMKLDISVSDGWTRLEYHSFDAYNEATKLQEMIENFHKREGHYPSRVLADKIYRNRENLSYCKKWGIRLSGPALGRPKKGEDRNKVQDYRDECERVEIERKFSLGKRRCGIGLVTAKLEETAAHVVALSILLLNLRKIQCAILQFWDWLIGFLQPCEIMMVIQ